MPRWSPENIWRPAPLGLVGLASLLVWDWSGYCPAHQRAKTQFYHNWVGNSPLSRNLLGLQNYCSGDCSHEIEDACFLEGKLQQT